MKAIFFGIVIYLIALTALSAVAGTEINARPSSRLSLGDAVIAVINATPYPQYYETGRASETKLFDLGVLEGTSEDLIFVRLQDSGVLEKGLNGQVIARLRTACAPSSSVQKCAAMVMNYSN